MTLTFIAKPRVSLVIRGKKGSGSDDSLLRFCQTLHIVDKRDSDGTAVRVVRVMLDKGKNREIGGTELAHASGLKRVTVLHHLKRLEEIGMVRKVNRKYRLAPISLESMMLAMKLNMLRMLDETVEVARNLDREYCIGANLQKKKERRRVPVR